MRLILFIIAIAAVWFAYTNWGTSLNTDKFVKDGQNSLKNEKSINRVLNTRDNTARDNQEILDKI